MNYQDELGNWEEIILEPSGDTLPIGAITQFGGETAPTNWLFCNGQAVSRETYAELFEAIGTTYGDGDGSTTFNLPDFSSRSPMGLGTGTDQNGLKYSISLGQTYGEYQHTLTEREMPSHKHNWEGTANVVANNSGNVAVTNYNNTPGGLTPTNMTNTGGGQAHNTVHPILGVNFIIKAKQSIGIVGNISEDITDTNDNAVPTCETVKDYVDSKEKAIMQCGVSADYSPAVSTYVECNNLEIQNGKNYTNKFSISNGKIKIGAGVTKVKITRVIGRSGSVATGWDTFYSYLRKNGENVTNSWAYIDIPKDRCGILTNVDVVDVNENDLISFNTYYTSTYAILKNTTHIIVEEV